MNAEFFEAVADIEKEKGIPREYMFDKITQAMLAAYGKDAEEWIEARGAKYHLDLKAINRLVLHRVGVEAVEMSSDCTVCQCGRFWSHRVTGGRRGSQGAIIVCREGKP